MSTQWLRVSITCAATFVIATRAPEPAVGAAFEWAQQFGTATGDISNGVAVGPDKSVYVTGLLGNDTPGGADPFLKKFDSDGNPVWTRYIETSGYAEGRNLTVDSDGNAYVIVNNQYVGPATNFSFLKSYAADGALRWEHTFAGYLSDVATDDMGKVYVSGVIDGPNDTDHVLNSFAAALSSSGASLWSRVLDQGVTSRAEAIATDGFGHLVVGGGVLQPSDKQWDGLVIGLDLEGQQLWTTTIAFGPTDFYSKDIVQSVALDRFGNAFVAGETDVLAGGTTSRNGGSFVAKVDSSGNNDWTHLRSKQIASNGPHERADVASDDRGNVYFAAPQYNMDGGSVHTAIEKYDTSGKLTWSTSLSSGSNTSSYYPQVSGHSIAANRGGVYVTGHTFKTDFAGADAGDTDAFVAKIADITTCDDIVRNAVKVQVDGDAIRAEFTPNFGMTLEEAAEHCGVQSFNWVQTVTLPSGYSVWKIQTSGDTIPLLEIENGVPVSTPEPFVNPDRRFLGIRVDQPVLDPILDGATNAYVVTWNEGDSVGFAPIRNRVARNSDGLPFYWNLTDTPFDYSASAHTSDFTLEFEDVASLPYLSDGEFQSFRTSLVGIKKDGSIVSWSALGTNLDWKSDRTHVRVAGQDLAYFSTLAADAPAYLAGGIFDVRLDGTVVPESTSQALAVCATIVSLSFGHRRRRSSQSRPWSSRA